MNIAQTDGPPAWILLVFTLPAKRASQRVDVWRKLRRYGALPLKSGGHVLPNSPSNREHFEWLVAVIRRSGGHGSVVQAQSLGDLSDERVREMFLEARAKDYESLATELSKWRRSKVRNNSALPRLRRRYHEVVAIDFFDSPLRSRIETQLARAERPETEQRDPDRRVAQKKKDYRNRTWITRSRPGIDRVSSAWLIRKFIDEKATFIFGSSPDHHPKAIPFDMFQSKGFGHRGEDCTFETLCKEFWITDPRVLTIARVIHDADLEDEKYGRSEGVGLDRALIGWAKLGISDEELLRRGMDLIEGLYNWLP